MAIAEERLRNPAPGSRIEAAKTYGIDLTLVIRQLQLSPTERAREMEEYAEAVDKIRGASLRSPAQHLT